jgi:molybdopterin-containing oxidoreductase family iron-sulfur binding subunit
MLLDTKTCIGCLACTVACKVEHNNPPAVWMAPVISEEIGSYPEVHRVHLPLMCMQCEDAPCVSACPTGAIRRRPDGIVVIDSDVCCGSGACVVACPHGALQLPRTRAYYYDQPTPFERAKGDYFPAGTAQKCDLCADRVDRGLVPACVEACPTESRIFGDLDDPASHLSVRLRLEETAELQTGVFSHPTVRYTTDGLRDAGVDAGHLRLPYRVQEVWHSYHAGEFTLLGAGGGVAVAHLLSGAANALSTILVDLAALLVALGGLVLLYDLGRPLRFLRALKNQRSSWISRGALGDFIFLLVALALVIGAGSAGNALLSVLLALTALLVMTYPALAMASLRAVPAWSGVIVPLAFLVDGLSLGVGLALVTLLGLQGGGPGDTASYLGGGLVAGALLRAALLHVYRTRLRRLPASQAAAPSSTRSAWRVSMVVGVLAAVLFALLGLPLVGGLAVAAAALATAATFAGSFAGKLLVLRTGAKPSPVDPEVEASAV